MQKGLMHEPRNLTSKAMQNIGQCIKDELARQERTISWLSTKLNCQRSNIYRMLRKNSIDTQLLQHISLILNHNFFRDLADEIDTHITGVGHF